MCGRGCSHRERRLDGSAFVHGPVALGDLVQREGEVEDLPSLDLAVPDEIDELGQEPANRRRAAVQMGMAEEEWSPGSSPCVTPT
jgi:hypothetical protein